jgi:hypothetical protein
VSTDLFQALTLGLLVIVILALLVAVSMLGRVRAMLERSGAAESAPVSEPAPAETAAPADQEPPPDAGDAEVEDTTSADDEPTAGITESTAAANLDDEGGDSDRPFERGGRWYFRRGGELLVYEEGTGEWVPASSSSPDDEVRRQADAVAASTEPPVAEETASDGAGDVRPGAADAAAAEASTSFAGQPLATAEEEAVALEVTDETTADDSSVASLEEPGAEISLDDAPEEIAPRSSESFWRCASCGAVNGSTATTCRMCFAPRP